MNLEPDFIASHLTSGNKATPLILTFCCHSIITPVVVQFSIQEKKDTVSCVDCVNFVDGTSHDNIHPRIEGPVFRMNIMSHGKAFS
jgi:hypothetical protein